MKRELFTHLALVFALLTFLGLGCESPHPIYDSQTLVDDANQEVTERPLERPQGLAVSERQGVINWAMAKELGRVRFAYAQATIGADVVDRTFERNWFELGRQGVLRGAYHHYMVGQDYMEQLRNFAFNVKMEGGDLIPAVLFNEGSMPPDAKIDLQGAKKSMMAFLEEVKARIGCQPIIFTDKAFANKFFDDPTVHGNYKLWLVYYDGTEPSLPNSWMESNWVLWQYSEHGDVPGVPENVARTMYHSTILELKAELPCR